MNMKIKEFWNDLDQTIPVNKRELVLGIAVLTLAGTLIGMLISPRKTMTIGSNNGNNNQVLPTEVPAECEETDPAKEEV